MAEPSSTLRPMRWASACIRLPSMQRAPAIDAVRPRRAPFWPRRILLAGGDSVVSRALMVFLRKEGFDAAVVSEYPDAWSAELSGRPFASDRDASAAAD